MAALSFYSSLNLSHVSYLHPAPCPSPSPYPYPSPFSFVHVPASRSISICHLEPPPHDTYTSNTHTSLPPPFSHRHHHTTHQPPPLNADANTAFACLPSTAMREVKGATVCLCTTDSLTPSSVCDLCDRSIQHATPRTNGV
jgi:hypothetical protein